MEGIKKVTLIRKQATKFDVFYPFQLPDGRPNAKYTWLGTKGKSISKKEVPVEVYRWLQENTSTIRDGHLILDEIDENVEDDELMEIRETSEETIAIMNNAIKTEDELKDILNTGNHLTFKKSLNELIENIEDEEQKKEIKTYVYKTYMEMGIESTGKIKVLCDWYGSNYEDCKDLFDIELDEQ